jgi:hypothetical protein
MKTVFPLIVFFLFLIQACEFNFGGDNKLNFDYETKELVSSKYIGLIEIESNNPTVYYSYEWKNPRQASNKLNIINPDSTIYSFSVSQYSKDTIAYNSQKFLLRSNSTYKITNRTNGDGKRFFLYLKTDSIGNIIRNAKEHS